MLSVVVMTAVVLLMVFIRPAKPWRYLWWFGGFITPLALALTLQLYFNNPENYPKGLCLKEWTERIKPEEREAILKRLKVQEDILSKRIPPSLRDKDEITRVREERRNLLLDTEAEKKKLHTPRLREIKIVKQETKEGNSYVALLENGELQWGRDFKLRFDGEVNYEGEDCSEKLENALKAQ